MSCSHHRGFTLVEIVVALSLLVVGALSLSVGVAACMRLATRGRSTARVADALLDRASEIRTAIAATGCGTTPAAFGTAPLGIALSHDMHTVGSRLELSIVARWQRPGSAGSDTVRTAIAC